MCEEQEFWILALCGRRDSEEIEVRIISSDEVAPDVIDRGMWLQVVSLSKDKAALESLAQRKDIKDSGKYGGFFDPQMGIMCLGSRDKQEIVFRATGNPAIRENKIILCGKGKWRFRVYSAHGNPFTSDY